MFFKDEQKMKKDLQKLSKNAILRRKGYILEKKDIKNSDVMRFIKETLTVTPIVHKDYAQNVKSFPIFFENKTKLFLPPYWAFDNIGQPSKNFVKNGLSFTSELKTIYPPRDYQEPIVKKVLKQLKKIKGGIITIGCGAGKTFLAIYLATLLKQKTLIIVHTSVLLTQWVERINYFVPDATIGIIKGKKFDIEGKDFVIAMLQSVVSESRGYDYKTFKEFGTTIVDECHHIAAPSFSKALPIISTKYTIGLSATPKRNDKLEKIFYYYLGPSAWYDRKREGIYTMVKYIKYEEEDFVEKKSWTGGYDLHKMVKQIIENPKRNQFIIKQLQHYAKMGRQTIVLSTRRAHLEELKELFDKTPIFKNKYKDIVKKICKHNYVKKLKIRECINSFLNIPITSGMYVGGMKPIELEVSSKCDNIFATYQLVSEGTDIPTLNTLIMASPKKAVEQVVGRIQRAKTEHCPLVLDICDMFSVYRNQGKFRQRFYKRQDYYFEEIEFDANNDKLPIINDKEKNKCRNIKDLLKKKKKTKNVKKTKKVNEPIILEDCCIMSD